MRKVTIHATMTDEDWDEFVGKDELGLSLDARLNEVFGDDGSVLTSMRVQSVDVV